MSLPSEINPQLLATNTGYNLGYNLTRSLRFRASASGYLSRTPSVAGNRQKFTVSVWYKAGIISTPSVNANILGSGDGSSLLISGSGAFGSTVNDRLIFRDGGGTTTLYWPMVFRDTASWYHIVFAMDTTQATAANRAKLYVNGVDQGAFSGSAPAQNTNTNINSTNLHTINSFNGTFYYSDLYYTEYNFVDGQQLTPSSFGSVNAATGVWQPARYTGTYGTNGFYLPFTDNSALTTSSNVGLGKDFSGNGNYWVTNNISITAGVTYDSMTDVPTLTSATAANFCTWNPVAQSTVINGTVTRSNGNLTSTDGGTTYGLASFGTIAATTGKFYWEVTLSAAGDVYANIGVIDLNSPLGAGVHTGLLYAQNGTKNSGSNVFATGGGGAAYGASYTVGDVIGVALDLTASIITFYKNGTSQGVAYTGISGNYTPAVGDGQNTTSYTFNLNCGQRPFQYTPPTGFVSLNTFNLPDSTIKKGNTVMDATLYTGDGAASKVIANNAGFKPDFVWGKPRSGADQHWLTDSVRGVGAQLNSNSLGVEITNQTTTLLSFNSNGYTIGASTNLNRSGYTFVGWQWQAGASSSSNTNGSITSTVSVNASAGFSVVTYTGTGAAATIGHGLGVAPQFIIIKDRVRSTYWMTYHVSVGATKTIFLNDTGAGSTDPSYFNNTVPTSSVFSVGNSTYSNFSADTYVAYCWTPIAGYSAFGSVSTNGAADNAFVYTGFLPRFVLFKRTDSTSNWYIWDTARNTFNVFGNELYPNLSDAEASAVDLDILSNGFKLRSASFSGTWIYAAFATTPFKNSLGF